MGVAIGVKVAFGEVVADRVGIGVRVGPEVGVDD